MKQPKERPRPRLHTKARINRNSCYVNYYCTTCGQQLNYKNENKRCRGGSK